MPSRIGTLMSKSSMPLCLRGRGSVTCNAPAGGGDSTPWPKDIRPLGESGRGRQTYGGGVGMSEQFDLIVIGGGSAARDAAGMALREHDARVALIEKERWGGSCPNVACTPTKAYLVAAELTHDVNVLAPAMGIEAGPATVDLGRLRASKVTIVDALERISPNSDAEASAVLAAALEEEGIEIATSVFVKSARREDEG